MGRIDSERESEIKERLVQLDKFYDFREQLKDELCFMSGDQFSQEEQDARGNNRPCLVFNYSKKYKDRIVNPTKQTPYKSTIRHKDDDISGKMDLEEKLQEILDDTVNSQIGRESIDTSFDTTVTCGYGYIGLGVDYVGDKSLYQKVVLNRVIDPVCAMIEPGERIDGSDSNFGVYIKTTDSKMAKEKYGEDALIDSAFWAGSMYSILPFDESRTPELMFYEKVNKKIIRGFGEDGTQDFEKKEDVPEGMETRVIDKYEVRITKLIGNEVVYDETLPIDSIMIYPFYGEPLYEKERVRYTGLVHLLKDNAKSLNFIENSISEQISVAPISQWAMAEGQDESHPDHWSESNVSTRVLKYDFVKDPETGAMAPPPFRVDNTVQVASLIAAKQDKINSMGVLTGMPDVAFGMLEGANQSAKSVISRTSNSEISNFGYLDNAEKTLHRLSWDCIKLTMMIDKKPFELELNGENVMVTWQMLMDDQSFSLDDFELVVGQGPRSLSAKQEGLATMVDLVGVNPNGGAIIWDKLIEMSGAPESEDMARRYRKTLDPEILDKQEGGPGLSPEALQIVRAAQQATQDLEQQNEFMMNEIQMRDQVIGEMRTQQLSSEKDNQTKIVTEVIKSETDIEEQKIQAEADIQTELIKQGNEVIKQEGQITNKVMDIANQGLDMARVEIEPIESESPEQDEMADNGT